MQPSQQKNTQKTFCIDEEPQKSEAKDEHQEMKEPPKNEMEDLPTQAEKAMETIQAIDAAFEERAFLQNPATCYSYVLWQGLKTKLSDYAQHMDRNPQKIETYKESFQSDLQRPWNIWELALADLNLDGVPELLLYAAPPGWGIFISIYDVSGDEPELVHTLSGGNGDRLDFACWNNGGQVVHFHANRSHGQCTIYTDAYFMYSEDGGWDVWEGRVDVETADIEAGKEIIPDIFRNDEMQSQEDGVFYWQLANQPTAPAPEGYFVPYNLDELRELTGHDTTGEDWWVSYAKMLWQVYTESPAFATTQQNWAEHHPGETPPWEQSDAA